MATTSYKSLLTGQTVIMKKKSGIGQPGRRVEGLSCGHSARLATGSVRASLCAGCFTSCTLTLIIAQCSVFTAVVPMHTVLGSGWD